MPTPAIAELPLRPSTRTSGRKRRKVWLRWVKRVLLIAIALGIAGGVVWAWLPDPIVVDTATVQRMPLATEIAEDGRTRVRDRHVISAPITGELRRIELDPGDLVRAGDVVATIAAPAPQLLDARSRDEARARLALAIAHERTSRALLAKARAARDIATREAARTRQLVQRGAISGSEDERAALAAEIATRDVATAEAQRAAANAEIDAARALLATERLASTTTAESVRAPANGQILRVLRESAGPIATGAPLLEIGDLSGLELVIDVLSSQASRVRPGMPVEIDRWGGAGLLRAVVSRVEPAAFTRVSALGVEEQRVRIIAAIESPPPSLGDGFGVAARIITWRAEAVLAVPVSAVFRHRGQWAVYVVEDGRAHMRMVTIGHRGRLDVEVEDLPEGTCVVLHPGDSVREGARVRAR